MNPAGELLHTRLSGQPSGPVKWDHWDGGFSARVSCACDGQGRGYVMARRNGDLVRAPLALGGGEINTPVWESVNAPFKGPALMSAMAGGPLIAVGIDDQQVLWMKTWDGSSWTPAGRQWDRVGILEELLGASKERRASHRLTSDKE